MTHPSPILLFTLSLMVACDGADTSALESDLDETRAALDAAEARIADLETRLTALEGGGYLTASDLTGLATEAYVDTQTSGLLDGVPTDADLDALTAEVDAIDTRVAVLEASPTPAVISALAPYLQVNAGRNEVIFTGANVLIQSGAGSTDDNGSLTGLGNLIIGYNGIDGDTRTGSH
ncbi:MAG: hypothetical protein AAFV53_24305, partial [Myxococcota bacterium]